jgi:hypothetical protein
VFLIMTGTAPLIMHNVQTADPLNYWSKEIAKLTAKKRNKTESDDFEISRLKFAAGLYHDKEIGPYLPAANIFRALIEAGAMTRDGKNVERGVVILADRAPLEYDGPRDIDGMWGDGATRFVDRRVVAVQRQRIVATRPIFSPWAAMFEVDVDPEVLNPERFAEIAVKAGRSVGVGDYRRFYGKFAVQLKDS